MFHIFDEVPKIARTIAIVTTIFVLLIGFAITIKLLFVFPGYFFLMFLFFVLLALGTFLAILYGWRFMINLARMHTVKKMEQIYQQQGFSQELIDCAKIAATFPANADVLLQIFLLLMAERYIETSSLFMSINVSELTNREKAMYYACKMQLYVMTGQIDNVIKIYTEHHEAINLSYEMKPNFHDQYTPYADDALTYYIIAAALSARQGNAADTEECIRRADFQITSRSEAEIECYPEIIALNILYATGKFKEAYEAEQALRGKIISIPMGMGVQEHLNRLVGQARIYGTYVKQNNSRMAESDFPQADSSVVNLPTGLSEM